MRDTMTCGAPIRHISSDGPQFSFTGFSSYGFKVHASFVQLMVQVQQSFI